MVFVLDIIAVHCHASNVLALILVVESVLGLMAARCLDAKCRATHSIFSRGSDQSKDASRTTVQLDLGV